MKYMMLIAGDEDAWAARPQEETKALYEGIGQWWGERSAAGVVVDGHELEPSSTATTVRVAMDGSTTVTDGPFIEGKELLGGFGILDVADLDQALSVAATWPVPGDVLEIRPIVQRD